MKKLLSILMSLALAVGCCGLGLAEDTQEDFLSQVQGTFVELFPELSKEEYREAWLSAVTPLVGEEAAEETVDYLLYMCTGEVYGQEAIDLYTQDPESTRFDCYFLGGMVKMQVEGNVISGVDAEGNEVFRHAYKAMDLENENGFLFYESEDAQAGQFTYFAFAPDTMADTFHLEFRYAEKLEDLQSWFEGDFAYWNAAAIAEDYTQAQILDAINLFATENLSESEDDAA